MSELERLALSVVLPGFEGPVVPDWVRRRIEEGLGGVVLYAWNVESGEQLAALTRDLRAERSDVIVAIDEEGGDVTRLEAGTGSSYPGNAALGVVDDAELTRRVAASIGAELAGVGVNLDFAPVADVNTNPRNPVIGIRSFGSDAGLVARHVAAYVSGMQSAGIAACAKHFPGHGDTALDSHLALPFVDELDREALRPFLAAIDAGVLSIMTAHIVVRSLGEAPGTMSPEILRDLLRDELGFDGLVVTDALEMKAISDSVGVEEGAIRAIVAGADALCLGHDLFDESVVSVRDALADAVRSGRLREERLRTAASSVASVVELATMRGDAVVDPAAGRLAARRALRVEGHSAVDGPVLVVELVPDVGMAAGRLAQQPGEWFQAVVPETEVRTFDAATFEPDLPVDGRRLVVIVRDAHRHPWERDAVDALTTRFGGDAVVVEIGLPEWRPRAAATYVATYGAARVNVEAAAEALYSGPRRGVEQSGSSPGS